MNEVDAPPSGKRRVSGIVEAAPKGLSQVNRVVVEIAVRVERQLEGQEVVEVILSGVLVKPTHPDRSHQALSEL